MNVKDATELKEVCHRLLFNYPLAAYAMVQLVCDRNGSPQDLVLLDANSTWEQYSGVQKENVIGSPIKTGPLFSPVVLERIAHTLQVRHPTYFELYAPTLDRWFSVICDAVGTDGQAACILFDTNGQKTTSDGDVSHDDRYRTLILACSEWIAKLSPDGRILYPIRAPWPLPCKDQTGCNWINEIIPRQDQAIVTNFFRRAIAKKQPIMGNIRIVHPDGSIHWLHSRAVPILNQNGEISEWFAEADDITERKRVEAALRDSEGRLSYLLKLSDKLRPLDTPDAILKTVCDYLANYLKTVSVWFCEWDLHGNCITIRACTQQQGASMLHGRFLYRTIRI